MTIIEEKVAATCRQREAGRRGEIYQLLKTRRIEDGVENFDVATIRAKEKEEGMIAMKVDEFNVICESGIWSLQL